MSRSLVTAVAAQLMEASATTVAEVSTRVLAQVVDQLRADAGFLRVNDHNVRASKLVAEWPPRPDVPRPDPLAVIHFVTADPVYQLCGHIKRPTVIQREPERHRPGRSLRATRQSVAVAPLLCGQLTTGMLGLVRFGTGKWQPDEIDTIEAIGYLFAQLEARIAAEAKLRHLADHDELTGLLNRRGLVARLSRRLAAGQPGPVAVMFLDLDRLKAVNDNLGHSAGDRYIQMFADRLRACCGKRYTIARLGGDEFVVVPDHPMTAATAQPLADRLRTMLRDRVELRRHLVNRSVSIGVEVGRPEQDTVADLLSRADEAVLKAKRAGGDRVVVATDNMCLKTALTRDIKLHLQGGVRTNTVEATGALSLHYLPEVDLWSGAVVAAEALLRWHHPTRGLLSADSFIGMAESTSLAGELGQWVMRTACTEFSRWRSRGVGENITLRVNVSPAQLVATDFVRSVADTIEEFGIDPGSLCLEITERTVVRDIEATRRTLTQLKEVGVQIAIDDFGTGYAVLSHLKALPVDTLKIDRSFTRALGTNCCDLAIIRAVIGLADAFGLSVVAEGIQTPAAALTLMQNGCQRAQGFLLSPPLPGSAMEALLANGWVRKPFLVEGVESVESEAPAPDSSGCRQRCPTRRVDLQSSTRHWHELLRQTPDRPPRRTANIH